MTLDTLLLISNELYVNFCQDFEEKINKEIEEFMKDSEELDVLERYTFIHAFVTEIEFPSQEETNYMPGVQRVIDINTDKDSTLNIWIIAKLALINTVIEQNSFSDFVDKVQRLKTSSLQPEEQISDYSGFNDKFIRFLTQSNSSYVAWKTNLQSKLYNKNRANPLKIMSLIISDAMIIKVYADTPEQAIDLRLQQFLYDFNEELEKVDSYSGIKAYSIPSPKTDSLKLGTVELPALTSECEGLLKIITDEHISFRNHRRISNLVEKVAELKILIKKWHLVYGQRHSVFHFLRYMTVILCNLTKAHSLSSREVLQRVVKSVEEYKNEETADKLIFFMPFVGKKYRVNPTLTRDEVSRLFSEIETKSGSAKAVWEQVVGLRQIGQWIMALRDLAAIVLNISDLTIKGTKENKLASFETENPLLDTAIKNVRALYNEMTSHEEINLKIEFDKLVLFHLTAMEGPLRKLLKQLIQIYNEKLRTGFKFLKLKQPNEVNLNIATKENLFSLTFEDLMDKFVSKYWGIDQKKKQMQEELASELKLSIQNLPILKDNVSDVTFNYIDVRIDKLITMAENHPLWKDYPQKIPDDEMKDKFMKTLRQADPNKVLLYENSLFNLVVEKKDQPLKECLTKDEITFVGKEIHCGLSYLLYVHKMILIKKMQPIFNQYKSKASLAKFDDILSRLFRSKAEDTCHAIYCFIAAVAENKDEKGILNLIANDSSGRNFDWRKPLINVESVAETVAKLNDFTASNGEFVLLDLCSVCNKIMDEL